MLTIVKSDKIRQCGFCQSGHHNRCAIGTRTEGPPQKYPHGAVFLCQCEAGGCVTGRRKCTYCGNRTTSEVSETTWECLDIEACKATVQDRRDNDPLLASLREAREKAKMTEQTAKAEKVAKKETFCLVTGEPTSGGLFRPGMDARYVSERVTQVINAGFTKKSADEQRSKMKKDGVSEKLVAKFEKSLGLAQAKEEKAKAAKAEKAAAKEAEKAEKANA